MNSTKLKKYSSSSLVPIKDLGKGSYGNVRLFYHKELKQHVAGKAFLVTGNQEYMKKRCAEAEREAKILARIKHKNVIRVLGTTEGKDRCFTIILEYACCGDLQNLLMNDTDIPLSWAIRARFFVELADALNYLHYHDHINPYVHGDLKPQNILLGDLLTIKLADFGATSIAKLTGATSLTISGVGNTQHTPNYTAPEFLRDPNTRRNCSMDVYSYGMIGYEIITREEVYSGIQVNYNLLIDFITSRGQKPDEDCIEKVDKSLQKNSSESVIFHKLNEIVHQCWQTKAEDRPKICYVKKQLDNLTHNKQIYDKVTNTEVRSLIARRKLKPRLSIPTIKPSSKTSTNKKLKKISVVGLSALCVSIIGVLIAMMSNIAFRQSVSKNATVVFLGANANSFKKYAINSKLEKTNISTLLRFPEAYASNSSVPDFVEVLDFVYFTSFGNNTGTLKLDLSKPSLKWKKITWKDEYKCRKYIAYKDTIMAVGTYVHLFNVGDVNNDFFRSCYKLNRAMRSFEAYMYNTTSNKWTQLPNMKEPRLGYHTVVMFQGLICAVGGELLTQSNSDVECYNPKTNQWSDLPPMKIARRFAAAVELNSELYVIGGMMEGHDSVEFTETVLNSGVLDVAHDAVEKYNPVTNKWTKVANLIQKRMCHSAGIFDGKIYVIGGIFSDMIEAYDPLENSWSIVSLVPEFKFQNAIYIASKHYEQ